MVWSEVGYFTVAIARVAGDCHWRDKVSCTE